MERVLRAKSKMNKIGPVLICACLIFNLYAVLYFYVFPFTDILDWDADIAHEGPMAVHYTLFGIYFALFCMTIWSFIMASCTDPGYVPRNLINYDKAKLPKRELLLWNYIENLGLDPNQFKQNFVGNEGY